MSCILYDCIAVNGRAVGVFGLSPLGDCKKLKSEYKNKLQIVFRYIDQLDRFSSKLDASCASVYRDGILEQHFLSRFLGIILGLLRLDFLPSFLLSTKCYS